MAVTVVINGTSFSFPQTFDENWGDNVTNWAVAVSAYLLQRTGGSFPLSADADFGGSFGLKSLYYKSRAAAPATSGEVRLGNTESISWRNAGNNANLPLSVDASNNLTYNGVVIATSGAIGAANTVYVSNGTNPVWALLVNANIDVAAAIAYSKLALTSSIVNADISASAAIAYSKLNLTGAILNADISASAAIAYSKLSLSNSILNADINSAAAIALSKLAALSSSIVPVTDGSGVLTSSAVTATEVSYVSGVTSAIQTQINTKLANPLTTTGDTIYSSSGSTAARLAIGSTGQVLTVAAGLPSWSNANSLINVTAKTANYTLTATDQLVTGDATGSAFTLTLPTAVGATGRIYYLKRLNSGANAVNIATTSSQTIDGVTSIAMNAQYQTIAVCSDGANWQVLDKITPQVITAQVPTAVALKVVRGSVNGTTGALVSGEGFTPTRNGTGDYTITFTTAFTTAPTPIVGGQKGNSVQPKATAVSTSAVTVKSFDSSNTPDDSDFAFIFVGT